MVVLICSTAMWFGRLLLMKVCLTFLSSEKKIVLEKDISLARYSRFFTIAFLFCSGHTLRLILALSLMNNESARKSRSRFFVRAGGESVVDFIDQDIEKWELIISVDFISKIECGIALEGQL